MKRKYDSKNFAQQKRTRRQWLTFMRMIRYGVNNLTRNAWLTIAATAIMTITLLIIFSSLVTRMILSDTIAAFNQDVDMSLYLKTEVTKEDAEKIQDDLRELESVRQVTYVSPEKAREEFAERYKNNPVILESLAEATSRFSGTVRVNLYSPDDTAELQNFVDTNQTYKDNADPSREPSFVGDRKAVIDDISSKVRTFQTVGYVLMVIFIAISVLIVFNTIRMAIFNRKEEIYMMKLIGADRSFIRGPFIVEAISYGTLAAVIATIIGIMILRALRDGMTEFGLNAAPAIDTVTAYAAIVMLGMILSGATIGIISSLLATRRYLKI